MSFLNDAGEIIEKPFELIPGVKGLPGFHGNPSLLGSGATKDKIHNTVGKLRNRARLNQHEIAELWILEGGDGSKADEFSAIMMAESGGNARSDSNPCCKGLVQANVEVGNLSRKCAMNAGCSVKWAIGFSNNGTDWGPWEAYTNGAYKKYLGKSGIRGSDPSIASSAISGAEDAISKATGISAIVGFIARLFEPSFWLRVGKGIAGFLLMAFGALTLMKVLVGIDIPLAGPAGAAKNVIGL